MSEDRGEIGILKHVSLASLLNLSKELENNMDEDEAEDGDDDYCQL